ncbi:unnamed protein product [Mytilus edulis]|uniref:DUF6570 domain-containing protein n=1 Tax=Mytilus edulis TaxID=6550 RepID=A0A8S3PR54_MYTED|nr:unnamed protein product [Mytilus edulis]
MAGSSQNQWFEVTGVRICIENGTDNNELFESYNQASTSNSQLSENQENENKNSHEIIKTQENLTIHDHISPEILKSNICSNESIVIENNNEVHIDEGITDIESDVEMLSTINNCYDFKPLNTDSKRKLCIIAKIPTKKISKRLHQIYIIWDHHLPQRLSQPRFIIVEQHIQTLNMEENNVWGTELEILACADLLKTDIYTFYNGTWIKYSSSKINSNNCIGDMNHYEVVTNVTQKSLPPNPLQCRQSNAEKYQVDRKSVVTSKKMKVDENQKTGSIYNFGEYNTESKVLSKAKKEKIKYWTDDTFRARKTNTLKRKYWENEGIRSNKLCLGIKKYKENETYRENLIQAGIEKYKDDKGYKDALIQSEIEKYKDDKGYRDDQSGIEKYLEDPEYREKLKTKVCTCRTSLWICYTCHRKMLKGKIPADSFSNSLLLENVPVELKQLNSIEQQLIAQNIPFMKIMALPKGGQKGVHGPVVCVPSDLKKVTSILPRSEDESLLLKVKLKRKLIYKGYDKYQFVRPNNLEQALLYLKDQNIWYKDVAINNEWINPIPELNDNQVVNDESESDDTELVRENLKEEEKIITKSSTTSNEREIESESVSYIDDR